MPYVEVIRAGRKLREVSVENFDVTIGRDPGAHVRLDDEAVSRFHARLFTKDNGWFIEDLDARNGTYVNGAREFSCALRDGDRIHIGEWVVVFRRPPGEIAPVAPPKFVRRGDFARAQAQARGVQWEPLAPADDSDDPPTRVARSSDLLEKVTRTQGATRIVDARELARARLEATRQLGPHLECIGRHIALDRPRLCVGGPKSGADVQLPLSKGSGALVLEQLGNGEWKARAKGIFSSFRLDGRRCRSATLKGGEKLEVAGASFFFRPKSA